MLQKFEKCVTQNKQHHGWKAISMLLGQQVATQNTPAFSGSGIVEIEDKIGQKNTGPLELNLFLVQKYVRENLV